MPTDRLQALAWIAVGLAFLWLLYLLRPILAPFLLAAILAYICSPMVAWLESWRVPRTAGVLLVMLLLAAFMVLLVLILVPLVQKQAAQLYERLPGVIELLNDKVAPWIQARFGTEVHFDLASLRELVAENWESAQGIAARVLQSLRIGGLALVGVVANILLAPVVMFYLLRDWKLILAKLESIIPRQWRDRAVALLAEIDAVMAEFLRGQLSVMLLLAVLYSVGLWIAGVAFALPVGILTGLLVFIPYVGYAAGFILALLVAVLQFAGWGPIIGVLIVYTLGQLIESFVLTPYLVGERIGLHPLAVIFALMAFGQLFGFFGVLLALPASAALLVGLREVRTLYLKSSFYRGA